MPELPELEIARERLDEALRGRRVVRATVHEPFVLRTVEPVLEAIVGLPVAAIERRGKRLRIVLADGTALEIHLMRAGRLRLRPAAAHRPHRRHTLFVLEAEDDVLVEMTEAGTERRASLHVIGPDGRGAAPEPELEPLSAEFTPERFSAALRRENRQLKGALRDARVVAGIGNAYSDEILHAARLSPLRLTARLDDAEIARLRDAVVETLQLWVGKVRAACPSGSMPEKQDLWRRGFAVHGRGGEPCPVCGDRIERVSYRDSETHYCPTCQNEGRVLADRRRSRLGIPPRPRPPHR